MLELFRGTYYYLDLLVGFAAPLVFFILYKTGRIDKFLWSFFWIGVLVGTTWEIPIFVLSGEKTALPLIVWNKPLPIHYLAFMICHSLWDGMLFVIGVRLILLFCKKPCFTKFSASELAVMFIWGQASELCVELSSTLSDGWSYVEYWWNPVMFQFNGYNIAWLMQVIWMVAAVVYYLLLIKLKPKFE